MKPTRFLLRQLWNRLSWSFPLPIHLPYGGWWLAETDVAGEAIFAHRFEERERRFVGRFLQRGMVVLDIGAHHGYYTILASRKVGRLGSVVAFEPSPRERTRLERHLLINRCRNVVVESLALGSEIGEAELHVVEGRETGCNSLRPPVTTDPTRRITVRIVTLDHYLERCGHNRVNFIKLDVEGAELEVLKGARNVLNTIPRPVILCEVSEVRTEPWGYPAGLIYKFLEELGFQWFSITSDGELTPCPEQSHYNSNLLGVPSERLSEMRFFITGRGG